MFYINLRYLHFTEKETEAKTRLSNNQLHSY